MRSLRGIGRRIVLALCCVGVLWLTPEAAQSVNPRARTLAMLAVWRTQLLNTMRAVLLAPEDQTRLQAYHAVLGQVSRSVTGSRVSLAALLPALFALSQERARHGDAVAENRAALLVLTFYTGGRSLATLVPAAQQWPPPVMRVVTLNGRDDLAKHFMISALLAAHVGAPLAEALGLYKEVEDARGGSGFSFNDLAADRAGTRFGELAVSSDATALRLQQTLSAGVREGDIIPVTADLPEFLPDAEFKRRFGGIGAPAYQAMLADIERRLAALTLYR